jgi:hypothetical protein
MKRKLRGNRVKSSLNITRATPLYPYDKSTDTISLPPALEKDILNLASEKGVPIAMKKAMELTGAGLKVSKNYIDNLLEKNRR